MGTALDLTDAVAKIERAKELHGELIDALTAWQQSGGVEAQSRRSLQCVCYFGYAKVNALPPINLPMRAGEVLHALRTALDYAAFQIYLAGGGAPDGADAHLVAFPIVGDPDRWDRAVARKVPGVWPEAAAALRAVQQFKPPPADPPSPFPETDPLLVRLATLGGTDKHRNLTMFAAGVWSASVITPEPQPWYATILAVVIPGPLLPTQPGQRVEVSRAFVQPEYPRSPHDMLLWTSGVELQRPDPPELEFGFRANDGTQIDAGELKTAIETVESIVERLAALRAP